MRKTALSSNPLPRILLSPLFRVYLPIVVCFFVINITNPTLLAPLNKHGLLYANGADGTLKDSFDKTAAFFLVPIKSFLFFVCTAVLLFPVGRSVITGIGKTLTRKDLLQTLIAMFASLLLTAVFFPVGFGRYYARVSVNPFIQEPNQLYRRLLIPGLANLYHLNGFLYTGFFWAIVLVAVLLTKLYFRSKGTELSLLHEVSLLNVGVFISAYQGPGYPEIAAFLFGMVALIEFEREGRYSDLQTIAFALALMTHESCAFIVFAPMIVFLFGRKAWLPSILVLLLYATALWSNFSFHLMAPLRIQAVVSGMPAQEYFRLYPKSVLMGVVYAFKLWWLFVPLALYYQLKDQLRVACFVVCGIGLAVASTYIGIDYSRLVAFATIPVLLCALEAHKRLSSRAFNAITALSLAVPSFFAVGKLDLITCRGLYYLIYRLVFKLPAPV